MALAVAMRRVRRPGLDLRIPHSPGAWMLIVALLLVPVTYFGFVIFSGTMRELSLARANAAGMRLMQDPAAGVSAITPIVLLQIFAAASGFRAPARH